MKVSRRASQRIPIHLEAELVSNKARCSAFIENISECGIHVKITCKENYDPDTKVNLKFRLPSGRSLHLICKRIWSKNNVSNSLIEHTAMEIINPPQEYKKFYQAVKVDAL